MSDAQNTLTLTAARHIQSAEGWLDLGDWQSANDELENITPRLRSHPVVLEMRFRVYTAAKHLELALEVAKALVTLTPHDENAWISRSFVLHDLKRTQEAYDRLLPALERFTEECIIPYNLACYACQLGDQARAKELLALAYESGEADEIKVMALDDPDLAPVAIAREGMSDFSVSAHLTRLHRMYAELCSCTINSARDCGVVAREDMRPYFRDEDFLPGMAILFACNS